MPSLFYFWRKVQNLKKTFQLFENMILYYKKKYSEFCGKAYSNG